jgi:hypothetical protein
MMGWIEDSLELISSEAGWGYQAGETADTEPVATAALALAGHDRTTPADAARQWLAKRQNPDGSLGISAAQQDPHWSTSLAILAWRTAGELKQNPYRKHIERAVAWMLKVEGKPMPRTPEVGHDTTLIGWPWVEGTHSWVEPTAFCVLALKATGHRNHPRTREAVRLLIDRQLPDGGCNSGNTQVLGAYLRPHLQPSGLLLIALADETDPSGRLDLTLRYVRDNVGPSTTASSLAYGLMGLAAHDRLPENIAPWLAASAEHTTHFVGSQSRRALLALSALGAETPLVTLTRPAVAKETP